VSQPPLPPIHPPVLVTPRLTLRPIDARDAADLFAIFSDPDVMRFWSSAAWTDIGQAHDSIRATIAGYAAGDAMRLGVEWEGRVVGTCTLFDISPTNRRAEIGYALASRCWGRGLMHEALSHVLDHAFGPMGLHRIEADIDPRNAPSARTLERLGFLREGTLRERWIVNGEISDTALYGLLAREWQSRREKKSAGPQGGGAENSGQGGTGGE